MSCTDFACGRLADCPLDIQQRITNGLAPALAVLGCGQFNFQQLIDNANTSLTSNLPVLFSSAGFRSFRIVEVTEGRTYARKDIDVDEYWFGRSPYDYDTMCARSGSDTYYYNTANQWILWDVKLGGISTFKSVPNVTLSAYNAVNNGVQQPSTVDITRRVPGERVPLATRAGVTLCQMSGNGLKWFIRDSNGWNTFDEAKSWEPISGLNDPALTLVSSFDGNTVAAIKPNSDVVKYKIGSAAVRTTPTVTGNGVLYAAVLGNTVFAVRGVNIYTVGSLNDMQRIFTLQPATDFATGVWADDRTVWVSTTTHTYMSNDAGWTWTLLEQQRAVGPSLFVTPDSDNIWRSSSETFVQATQFPLHLNNGGRLFNNQWSNWFEDTDTNANSPLTEITATTTSAVSPNGRYLFTNNNGLITLYLNVWNAPTLTAWCSGDTCNAARAAYCLRFGSIDASCTTPAGGGGSGGSPAQPKKGIPIGLIVGLSLLVALLIIAVVIWYAKRK